VTFHLASIARRNMNREEHHFSVILISKVALMKTQNAGIALRVLSHKSHIFGNSQISERKMASGYLIISALKLYRFALFQASFGRPALKDTCSRNVFTSHL